MEILENKQISRKSHASSAASEQNIAGTGREIDTQLTQRRSALVHALDCALRRSNDATKRMQLGLRMGMEREGSTPAFKARQDAILRGSNRVRAKAGREVLA
jgi:hypothetical protein